jgi:menaquinol-cytochrome c reductase iron-sulfur subunit
MSGKTQNRRWFLAKVTAAVLALPGVAYVVARVAKRREDSAFADAGPVADLPPGKWLLVPIELVQRNSLWTTRTNRSVLVRRSPDRPEEVKVLSPICPHLGCTIVCYPKSTHFTCPCHGGSFDLDGRLVSGPPRRDMDFLDGEIREGRLWVRWRHFTPGTRERQPA